jgi:hypothetical protein
MKEVLSLFVFGIGTLLFLAFLTALKPEAVLAVPGTSKPEHCSTEASPAHECVPPGWLRIFTSSPHAEPRAFFADGGSPEFKARPPVGQARQ